MLNTGLITFSLCGGRSVRLDSDLRVNHPQSIVGETRDFTQNPWGILSAIVVLAN